MLREFQPLTEPVSIRRAKKRRIRSAFGRVTLWEWMHRETLRLVCLGRDARIVEKSGSAWIELRER